MSQKQDAHRWGRIKGYLLYNWCMSPDEEDEEVAAVMEVVIACRVATDEWRAEAQKLTAEVERLRKIEKAARVVASYDKTWCLGISFTNETWGTARGAIANLRATLEDK